MLKLSRYVSAAVACSFLAACAGHDGSLPLQSQQSAGAGAMQNQMQSQMRPGPRPMYKIYHWTGAVPAIRPNTGGMPLWTGSFSYGGSGYSYTMVGANPATSNSTTTVPVAIIPVNVVIGRTTYSPSTTLSNGKTVIQNTIASPIYQSGITFQSGGQSMGNTQYLDAFQRGNFWSSVHTNTNYHLLLGSPTVMATQTLKPGSNASTGSPFGSRVGLMNINYFDTQANNIIRNLGISPGTIPVFVTYNLYLTNGSPNLNNCCIGGYHSYNGSNTYMQFTYMPQSGVFSQDVSALSHETGEWIDDPLTNNNTPCGTLEVGDPEEGDANYGDYAYSLGGFTYHLQDLTYLPYFGAPPSTSVNNQMSFQNNTSLSVCSNGA